METTASIEQRNAKETLKDYFVVSADSHVNEPPDLWTKRVDEKFRDRMPQIKVDEQGRKWFSVEGLRPSRIREAPRSEQVLVEDFKQRSEHEGKRPQLDRTKGAMFQQQGGIGPERQADMDYDGIDAEIVFPNKGLVCWASPDPEHNYAMCSVYNDWVHEAFRNSRRSFPVAAIPPADVNIAIKEIERVAKMGFHAIMIPPLLRDGRGYNSPDFDPMWAALDEIGMPICFHAGTGKDPRTSSGQGGAIINYVVHAVNTVLQPAVELCASGVLERFRNLQFATVEAGAGWVPFAIHAMDEAFEKHAFWVSPKLQQKPSEYFRQHGHASFQDDPVGIELRDLLGTDRIMWGNDYPHLEGTWPYSQEIIENYGMPRDDTARIVGLNAARLFNIDVPEHFRVEPKSAAGV